MYVLIDTVVFNYFNFDFNLLKVTCRVQQGSVLDPKQFILDMHESYLNYYNFICCNVSSVIVIYFSLGKV